MSIPKKMTLEGFQAFQRRWDRLVSDRMGPVAVKFSNSDCRSHFANVFGRMTDAEIDRFRADFKAWSAWEAEYRATLAAEAAGPFSIDWQEPSLGQILGPDKAELPSLRFGVDDCAPDLAATQKTNLERMVAVLNTAFRRGELVLASTVPEKPKAARDCYSCKHAGADPDGPYCAHPKVLAGGHPYGLALHAPALPRDFCAGPAHPLHEPRKP